MNDGVSHAINLVYVELDVVITQEVDSVSF